MSLNAATLRRLAALNLSTEAFQGVLQIIADMQAGDEERRANQRARSSRSRAKSRQKNVTVTSEERDGDVSATSPERHRHSDAPPVHILSPPEKKKEPKRVLSTAIDPDWQITPINEAYGLARGWDHERTQAEWQRFKDHYLASGKRMKDWNAAWRNWVTSPFQGAKNGNGTGENRTHRRPTPAGDALIAGMAAALSERPDSRLGGRDAGGRREGENAGVDDRPQLVANGRDEARDREPDFGFEPHPRRG